MKQQRTFLLLSVIVAVLVLGVAYAAITSVTLNVNGNVLASAEQGNFKVKFVDDPTFDGTGTAIVKVTSDTTATMDISGLTSVGDTMQVTYLIENTSADIYADLTKSVTNDNSEYFVVTSELSHERMVPGSKAKLYVTIRLAKTPLVDQKAQIGVKIVADPSYAS